MEEQRGEQRVCGRRRHPSAASSAAPWDCEKTLSSAAAICIFIALYTVLNHTFNSLQALSAHLLA